MEQEPRNLIEVIEVMLQSIPLDQIDLRNDLLEQRDQQRYYAPETQDWFAVASVLAKNMEDKFDEQWVKDTLALWRNDSAKEQLTDETNE